MEKHLKNSTKENFHNLIFENHGCIENKRDALIKSAMLKKGFHPPIEAYKDRGLIVSLGELSTFYIDDVAICVFGQNAIGPIFNSSEEGCSVKMEIEFTFQEL